MLNTVLSSLTGQAAMWFPIMMFSICGFEHAIANMAYVSLGLLLGAGATVDYRVWLYQNLILVILGNIVGGGLLVGGAEYFLFNWTKVLRTVQDKQTDLLRSHSKNVEPSQPCQCAGPSAPPPCSPRQNRSSLSTDSPDKARAREVFAIFDADGDGAVSEPELVCALGTLGFRHPLPLLRSVARATRTGAARKGPSDTVLAEEFEMLAVLLRELEGMGLCEAGA
jgi:hypothetical protein